MMASFNFGLGARMTYGQAFAVSLYASLPYLLVSLLTILTVSIGSSAETSTCRIQWGRTWHTTCRMPRPGYGAPLPDRHHQAVDVRDSARHENCGQEAMAQSAAVVLGWWLLICCSAWRGLLPSAKLVCMGTTTRLLIACAVISLALATSSGGQGTQQRHYVGSESCQRCHAADYAGWKQTRMANVVRDPKEHPEAVLGGLYASRSRW